MTALAVVVLVAGDLAPGLGGATAPDASASRGTSGLSRDGAADALFGTATAVARDADLGPRLATIEAGPAEVEALEPGRESESLREPEAGRLDPEAVADPDADPDAARASEPGGRGEGARERALERERMPLPAAASLARDVALQRTRAAIRMPAPDAAWGGLGDAFSGPNGEMAVGYSPPDVDGDVGRRDYLQVVNANLAILDKTSGVVRYGPAATNVLWRGFGGPCETNNDGDATVRYDAAADRWVVGQPAFDHVGADNRYCLAVSASGDPAGRWYRYDFDGFGATLPDFPKLGVWADAYAVTFNLFGAGETFLGSAVCGFDRAALLAGDPAARRICRAVPTPYHSLLPADLDGSARPTAGTALPLLSLGTTTGFLAAWRLTLDWANPDAATLAGPIPVPVTPFALACGSGGACIPQRETATRLDSLGDRLMYRLSYRQRGDEGSLVAVQTVGIPADPASTAGATTGIRWYELRLSSADETIRLAQSGTWAPDGRYRWLPSIAADRSGDIVVGYSLGDAESHPSLAVAGRLAGDPAGTLTRAEEIVAAGAGSQTELEGRAAIRWGDYASMTVDPVDDCTFYFAGQTLAASGVFTWRTSVATVRLPECAPEPIADLSPTAGAPGTAVTLTASSPTALAGATRVEFGGSPAEFSILDDGSLLAIVPEGAQSGPVAVTLPDGATTSARSFAVRASVPDGTTDGLDGAGGGSAVALPVPGDTTDPGSGVGGVTDAIAPPAILRSPTHRTVVAGARTTFVAESDDPGAAVAWEVSTDRGATWTTIAGAVGPSLTLTVLAGWEGRRYRAVFANEAGAAATAAASLGVVSVSALSRTRVRAGWTVTLSGRRLWTVRAVRVDGIAARFVRLADGRIRLVVPRGVSVGRIVLSTVVGTYRVPRRLVIL